MKKTKYIFLILISVSILVGCSKKDINENIKNEDSGKIKIVTTLFPQYDYSKELLKDKADVSLLLPPGVEAHSFEPTPKDIVAINDADYFIYTGEEMEPWVKGIINNINRDKVKVIDISENIEYIKEEEDDHGHTHSHDHGGVDPHFWLDPENAKVIVETMANEFMMDNESLRDEIEINKKEYIEKLDKLDHDIEKDLDKIKTRQIVYAGHFAFGYFADRYNLEYISPYSGFSPNAEPSPRKIAELIDIMKADNIDSIYFEELINPKVANILSEETGASTYLLHGAHNISKEELKMEVSYIDIMYQNLENLKQGLGYYD